MQRTPDKFIEIPGNASHGFGVRACRKIEPDRTFDLIFQVQLDPCLELLSTADKETERPTRTDEARSPEFTLRFIGLNLAGPLPGTALVHLIGTNPITPLMVGRHSATTSGGIVT